MGSERWRRIVEISSGFVDLALVGDPMQDDAWIVGDIGRAGAVVDFGGGPSTLTKTVVAAARYDGGTGALAWSRTFASSASGSSAPSVIAAAAGPTGRIAFLISVTDFNATDFGGGTLGTGLTSTHRAAVILDATGAHEASWVFSSPRIEAEHIAFAPDGTVVVAGDYHNVMPTIASSALPVAGSLSNAFVARYGPGGVGLGAFALASPTESTGIRQLAVMASGDIAVGTFDDFVASYSPTGTLRWNIATPRDFAMPGASMTYMHRAGTGLFAVGFQRNGYVLGGAPLTQPRFFAEIASDGSVGRVRGFDFFLQDARAVSATRWAAFGTWTAMASQRIQDRVVTLGSGGPTTPSGAFYFELAP